MTLEEATVPQLIDELLGRFEIAVVIGTRPKGNEDDIEEILSGYVGNVLAVDGLLASYHRMIKSRVDSRWDRRRLGEDEI